MADLWQLFVKGVGGKTTVVRVEKECTIDHLMETISKADSIPPTEMRVIYAGKQLEYNAGKTLSSYRIENMATLFIVLRLRGGWNPLMACSIRKKELRPLQGYIRVVTDEEDMISLDNDPNFKRAKMPCGHVIGPDSMTSYAKSLVDDGKYRFLCPHVSPSGQHCEAEWPYFLVRHVACLDADEMAKLESRITENFLNKEQGIQQCPGCSTYCFRDNNSNNRVQCLYCPKIGRAGKQAEFCWACLKPWNGRDNDQQDCRNVGCDGLDPRLRYLRDCPNKDIYKVACPSVRACPKCGILIDHKDGCKHVTCTACKYNFCFVCLMTQDVKGRWQCGSHSSPCSVAPVQTQLPGTQK